MKIPLSWLHDHLDSTAGLETISETLTALGLEVESLYNPAEELRPFTIAYVRETKPHPNADRLQVCKVETLVEGKAQTVQLVCGAPNARTGMKGVFASPGSFIPGTAVHLKPATIRGVASHGMLCSEREMGLSDEHDGIIEVDSALEVGTPFADAMGLNDPVIEVTITPNRPDCLGIRGIARDLAAAGLGTLKPLVTPPLSSGFDGSTGIGLEFTLETERACPLFAGCIVRGVKNRASPQWMQRRLQAVGLRPLNALVDITNYIAHDRARPLHVYDVAKLNGDVRARLGQAGESFTALDGKNYAVDETMCVIADNSGVLGLGGIMGGEASGVSEATTEVLVESAWFDPVRTAQTGRRLGIDSEARRRFERGVDPASVEEGCQSAAAMIVEFCGGEVSRLIMAQTESAPLEAAPVLFQPDHVNRLTGIDVPEIRTQEILTALAFTVVRPDGSKDAPWQVTPPSFRPDIVGSADLVEEVIRVYGVNDVPSTPLKRGEGVARPILTVQQKQIRAARRHLAGRGMVEAVTWAFIPENHALLCANLRDAEDTEKNGTLRLLNPISREMSAMRPGLLPGLIAAAGRNGARGFNDVALFEVGSQFSMHYQNTQCLAIAGLRRGTAVMEGTGRNWRKSLTHVSVYDAKADALAALMTMGAPVAQVRVFSDAAPDYYHPGRSGALHLGAKICLGWFGEVHPRILKAMDVDGPVVAFEIFPEVLPTSRQRRGRARGALAASDFQMVKRDFAFIVDSNLPAGQILNAVRQADKTLISNVVLFDVFEGAGIEADKKSLAVEVTLQPRHETLTDDTISGVSEKIIAEAGKLGAVLRTATR
ncbi:MAG: phenylalanine--tRNA ligase subunit beta [Parvularculales bacterium]